jgi:hypothetical protein
MSIMLRRTVTAPRILTFKCGLPQFRSFHPSPYTSALALKFCGACLLLQ